MRFCLKRISRDAGPYRIICGNGVPLPPAVSLVLEVSPLPTIMIRYTHHLMNL